jgi:hypothetical protein
MRFGAKGEESGSERPAPTMGRQPETMSMLCFHPVVAWIDSMPLGKLGTGTEGDAVRPSFP